jgi:hypothetical protein
MIRANATIVSMAHVVCRHLLITSSSKAITGLTVLSTELVSLHKKYRHDVCIALD